MANEQNLIPMNKRTPRERQEISRKGAAATNKKRKEQKTFRELAKIVLATKITDEGIIETAKQFGIENPDVKTITLLGMVRAAAGGSHNAFDRLMELTGEKEQDSNADIFTKLDKVIGEVDKLAE